MAMTIELFRCGQRDSVPPNLSKGPRLHVVKGGPHCIPWTHADEVNAELLGFLSEKVANAKREVA